MFGVVSDAARVIAGASGSPGSLCALRYAVALARRNNAPMVAALAWAPPGGDLAERKCPSALLRPVWAAAARERLEEALAAACGGVPADLDIKLVIIRGAPGPALVGTADRASDLLVVGAGRRGVLARMWHGSVSRYCLAHAPCPVLAIPYPATAKEMGLGPGARRPHRRDLALDRALRDWHTAA